MGLFFDSVLWDVATLLSIVAALAYHYLTSTFTFWERRGVPFVKPELFYGNVKDIIRFEKNQFETFLEFYNRFKEAGHKFGGIFQLRAPVLLVCSAELAKYVSVHDFPHFHDRKFAHDERFDPLSAHLLSLEGPKWKFLRSKLSPAFSTSKLKGMLEEMRDIGKGFVKMLEKAADDGEMVEMRKTFARYAMDVIAAVAFGLRINALERDSQFLHMGRKFFEPSEFERIMQIVNNTFPWIYKTFRVPTVPKDVSDFFMEVVRDTMEHRRKHGTYKNDFLHFLMKIDEEQGANLKDLEEMKDVTNYNTSVNENSIELTEGVIAAQAFVFFLAGYETSSSAMSACVHVLAQRPDIQDKMFQEVDRVVQKHGDVTYEALQELVYVEQVIEETLRAYPPVGLIVRQCTKPYRIPDTDVTIPKGCQVFIPIYSFHYDKEYFPEPEKFLPERFAPENKKKMVPYSFMPFGHGPRVCIGARLAMMEMKMSLSLIVKNFTISTCEKTKPFKINPKSFFLSPVDGLWVRFSRRI